MISKPQKMITTAQFSSNLHNKNLEPSLEPLIHESITMTSRLPPRHQGGYN